MTQPRLLMAVSPDSGSGEWQAMTATLADALLAHAPDQVEPMRAGANGWVRPGDRAPVAAPDFRDVIFVCAAGWDDPHQLRLLRQARSVGARLAVLVHDLAPLRRPEWFSSTHSARFADWLGGVLGLAQLALVPSTMTGRDLDAARRRFGWPETPIRRFRPGDRVLDPLLPEESPVQGDFVLLAGPIEPRMAQTSALATWHRLAARFAPTGLPALVLAGGAGGFSVDLRDRLDRGLADVLVIDDPSPAALAALYDSCQFVIAPAPVEGWSFPVTEALSRGCPVLAAHSGGPADSGQRLARYFDPLDPEDLARAVERCLRDPRDLLRWRGEIAALFRPRGWSETAEEVFGHLSTLA